MLSGVKAKEFLQSICSNDLSSLKPGSSISAAFLDRFGKVLAVSCIYNLEDQYLIESDLPAHQKLFSYLKDLIGFSNCKVGDMSREFSVFILFGLDGFSSISNKEILCISNPLLKKLEIFADGSFKKEFLEKGISEMKKEEWEEFRIENKIPEFGKDYDSSYLVLELGLDNLISYTKGCYTGQEIVARMKSYGGQTPRKIVKMEFDLTGEIEENEKLFKEGQEAGFITSVGKGICLATVKKEFFEKGTVLETLKKIKLVIQ